MAPARIVIFCRPNFCNNSVYNAGVMGLFSNGSWKELASPVKLLIFFYFLFFTVYFFWSKLGELIEQSGEPIAMHGNNFSVIASMYWWGFLIEENDDTRNTWKESAGNQPKY